MPAKRKTTTVQRKRKPRSGGSTWLTRLVRDVQNPSKVNNFLKRTKAISRVAGALSAVGVPLSGTVGNVAGKLGYGKRKRKRGRKPRAGGCQMRSGAGCRF